MLSSHQPSENWINLLALAKSPPGSWQLKAISKQSHDLPLTCHEMEPKRTFFIFPPIEGLAAGG